MSYIFYLLLQQADDLPLTVHHLTVEVDDYPDGKKCIRSIQSPLISIIMQYDSVLLLAL